MIGALIAKKKLRDGFRAVARGDLDALVSVFAEDAVLTYPIKETMRGKAAIREFYAEFFRTFPRVEPTVRHICVENVFDFVGTNVISAHWKIATTNRAGVTFEQVGVQLIDTRMGKVKRMEYLFADLENLRRAWRESA